MAKHHPDQPHDVAVSQLESLGLSTYAARTYVALVSLGEGTAQDVSHIADVPRTKVYEAAEELQRWGLVDVQQSTPRRFMSVSTETATRLFNQEYADRIDQLTRALDALDAAERTSQQRGVWTVTGTAAVTTRVREWIDDATEEVVFITTNGLLDETVIDALRAASDRDVAIKLGAMEPAVETRLQTELPDATLFDSMWKWSETPAGRLLMVDQQQTLASVVVTDDDPSTDVEETAIWGSGEANSLVTLLKLLFTWQIDDKGRA